MSTLISVAASRRNRQTFGRAILILAIATMLAAFDSIESLFAPPPKLWERWLSHDEASRQAVDHGAWGRLLSIYLSRDSEGVERFAYARVNASDREALRAYIARLSEVSVANLARKEQLVFWINLYNALTVELVLEHYPVKSIRDIDISPGLFSSGPWDAFVARVDGTALTLNDIEHRILRPIFKDPRIHYALNCASVGCPNLQPKAFTAANVDAMLNKAAAEFINDSRGAHVENGRLTVSSLYVWFEDDFGGNEATVIAHLRRYAGPQLSASLSGITRIADHHYDWALNDAALP